MFAEPVTLTPRTQTLSKEQISSIRNGQMVSISCGAPKNILVELAEISANINSCKLLLRLNDDFTPSENAVFGIDIFKFLPSIRHISILCFRNEDLANIDGLAAIQNLQSFSIDGHLKSKMDFSVLRQFKQLSDLSINGVILPEKYYDIINQNKLKRLVLRKLELSCLTPQTDLVELEILNDLADEERMSTLFPNLRQLSIISCRKLKDFAFISPLRHLEWLSMNTISGLTILPEILAESLHTLQLINCKNLSNIQQIYSLLQLKRLAITYSKINHDELNRIFTHLALENFYFESDKNKINEQFRILAEEYRIESHMLYNSLPARLD